MYLKQYFLYILSYNLKLQLNFPLSAGLPGAKQQAYVVKFSLPVNFVVMHFSVLAI